MKCLGYIEFTERGIILGYSGETGFPECRELQMETEVWENLAKLPLEDAAYTQSSVHRHVDIERAGGRILKNTAVHPKGSSRWAHPA